MSTFFRSMCVKGVVMLFVVSALYISGISVVDAQAQTNFLTCSGTDCSACNLVDMANRVIVWLIGILVVIFAVLMAYAGIKLVISGGNPGAVSDAKEMFQNAIIGFLLVLSAWLIVDTLMKALVDESQRGGALPWNRIECQVQIVARASDPPADMGEVGTVAAGVTGAAAGNRTPATDPIQAAEVRSILSAAGVTVQNGVESLDGLSRSRVEEIASLAQRCAQDMGRSCDVSVSSGVRTAGNPAGVGAHGTGNALDLSARSATFNEWMMNQSGYTRVQSFSGYTGYQSPSGNTVCTWESRGDMHAPGAHWHCAPPTR